MDAFYQSENFNTKVATDHANFIDLSSEWRVVTEEIVDVEYASYRKASSFDKKLWDVAYVQKEVVATILLLVKASRENRGLVDITLYLSRRLSIFRIEGSSNEVLVTREDPKDTAWRYVTSHHDFSAYAMELNWVRDESRPAKREDSGVLPKSLGAMFGESEEAARLEKVAARAMNEPSPYVR